MSAYPVHLRLHLRYVSLHEGEVFDSQRQPDTRSLADLAAHHEAETARVFVYPASPIDGGFKLSVQEAA